MTLAADYPLLEVFWTIALISLWALWIFMVVWMLVDNFGRHDHGGWAKAGWTVVIIVVPFLGVLIYSIVRPHEAPSRGVEASAGSQRAQTGTSTEQLVKLTELRDQGALSDAEFQAEKTAILGAK